MQAGEEIDALRVLGVDPIAHLVLPRLLALLLMAPALLAFGALVGIASGGLPAVLVYGLTHAEYLQQSLRAVDGHAPAGSACSRACSMRRWWPWPAAARACMPSAVPRPSAPATTAAVVQGAGLDRGSGLRHHGGLHRLGVLSLSRQTGRPPLRAGAGSGACHGRRADGPERPGLRGAARRGAGHRRPQRLRQEHAAAPSGRAASSRPPARCSADGHDLHRRRRGLAGRAAPSVSASCSRPARCGVRCRWATT